MTKSRRGHGAALFRRLRDGPSLLSIFFLVVLSLCHCGRSSPTKAALAFSITLTWPSGLSVRSSLVYLPIVTDGDALMIDLVFYQSSSTSGLAQTMDVPGAAGTVASAWARMGRRRLAAMEKVHRDYVVCFRTASGGYATRLSLAAGCISSCFRAGAAADVLHGGLPALLAILSASALRSGGVGKDKT